MENGNASLTDKKNCFTCTTNKQVFTAPVIDNFLFFYVFCFMNQNFSINVTHVCGQHMMIVQAAGFQPLL
jgi:hypothetical protein